MAEKVHGPHFRVWLVEDVHPQVFHILQSGNLTRQVLAGDVCACATILEGVTLAGLALSDIQLCLTKPSLRVEFIWTPPRQLAAAVLLKGHRREAKHRKYRKVCQKQGVGTGAAKVSVVCIL